ncbi:MAG: GEVED domain-containing protein [Dehalococcoidia bacterium]
MIRYSGRRFILLAIILVLTGINLSSNPGIATATGSAPAAGLKVAFFGDAGISPNAEAVLQLVEGEGADLVIHLGDFGYGDESDPQTAIDWDAQVTSILGPNFPYFGAVGNHDVASWPVYQQLLQDRLDRVIQDGEEVTCSGNYGETSSCTFRGLFFLLSGIGTIPPENDDVPHVNYIRDSLAQNNALWKICSWHKNQTAMQVGGKGNEVGWNAYTECLLGGAMIATGHEHSYSRSRTMTNLTEQTVSSLWPEADSLLLAPGSTFVFVSGIGGKAPREQKRCKPTTFPYGCNQEWASIYTSSQNARRGALFITFHVDGKANKAAGYFKNIDGEVIDTFEVTAGLDPLDYGDAPDSYGTLAASAGPSHIIRSGISLGSTVDGEDDGQPAAGADGDDLDLVFPSSGDDENGVTFSNLLVPGTTGTIEVDGGASGGMLDGWVDFNGNGIFDHPTESIVNGVSLSIGPGTNSGIDFAIPETSVPGPTYARFRLSSSGGLAPTGLADDGEVEDYLVQMEEQPPAGTIVIEKSTVPEGGSGFEFTNDIVPPFGFTLDHGDTEIFTEVELGSYAVTQGTADPDYDLSSVQCDDSDSTGDLGAKTAFVSLDSEEIVTCTFTSALAAPTPTPVPDSTKNDVEPREPVGGATYFPSEPSSNAAQQEKGGTSAAWIGVLVSSMLGVLIMVFIGSWYTRNRR